MGKDLEGELVRIEMSLAFVRHIENHIKEMGLDGGVLCKICNKTISEIYASEAEQ